MKVLLDTDIGSNIDDALCLAYLLAHDNVDLVGITTVSGEPDRRAALASMLCRAAGKHVPVVPGAAAPLIVPQSQRHAPHAASLPARSLPAATAGGCAVDFMAEIVAGHPCEVALLAIGPLTNVAQLFTGHPESVALLDRLVLMGGVFTARRRRLEPWERNTSNDPHATTIVYGARPRIHRSVGLDVTRQIRLPGEEVLPRLRGPLLVPARGWAEMWLQDHETVALSDPLAAGCLFDPPACTFERGQVDVLTAGPDEILGRPYAVTRWSPGREPEPHEVAIAVDVGGFLDDFWRTLGV